MNCLEYLKKTIDKMKQKKIQSQNLIDDFQGKDIYYLFSAGEAESIAKDNYNDSFALKQLAENFLNQSQITGSPNEFHNLSVNYSRKDDYINSCRILEKALEIYPNHTDLLADYLNSGINCPRTVKLDAVYNRLQKIPKMRWTWRSFSFSIDFMLYLATNLNNVDELNEIKRNALTLAEEYQNYFPDLEDVFICKYSIYLFFNDQKMAEKSLDEAVKKIKVCDRCALRYADILFEKGEFRKAYEMILQCIKVSTQNQKSTDLSYAYMLLGLCKILIFYDQLDSNTDIVKSIYKDFRIARESSGSANYDIVMEKQIRILEIKSGIFYDDVIDEKM